MELFFALNMMVISKNSSSSPIGIFDSGLGGLSIWKEIHQLLPQESTIYLADSANAPYGEKSKEEIIQFSVKNTELLLELGCKIIVIACNTATTNAIKILREKYDCSFIGIEPATKTATLTTKTKKIGILATKGTLNSDLFHATSNEYRDTFEIVEMEGKGLVELIEEGRIEETEPLLRKYLAPMLEKGVDNIVLGCTHYPFLIPTIKKIVPDTINILDSGNAVAKQTKTILEKENLLTNSFQKECLFYTNGKIEILTNFLTTLDSEKHIARYKDF